MNTQVNWHDVKMVSLLAAAFLIGVIEIFKGATPIGIAGELISVLTLYEHTLNGNTDTPSSPTATAPVV